jgi:hypothetical protein
VAAVLSGPSQTPLRGGKKRKEKVRNNNNAKGPEKKIEPFLLASSVNLK